MVEGGNGKEGRRGGENVTDRPLMSPLNKILGYEPVKKGLGSSEDGSQWSTQNVEHKNNLQNQNRCEAIRQIIQYT